MIEMCSVMGSFTLFTSDSVDWMKLPRGTFKKQVKNLFGYLGCLRYELIEYTSPKCPKEI
jgi:hypothetical protein